MTISVALVNDTYSLRSVTYKMKVFIILKFVQEHKPLHKVINKMFGTTYLHCHLQKELTNAKNAKHLMNPRKNLINTTKRNILMNNHLLPLLKQL